MTWFSDIERSEAVAIAELLTSAGRPELIADCLREGATLTDVRQRLAAEAAPAAAAKPARQTATTLDEIEQAAATRFAQQRAGLYRP